ncbi:hypothetical protein MRX96_009134 [Rhipicephalus microplus]
MQHKGGDLPVLVKRLLDEVERPPGRRRGDVAAHQHTRMHAQYRRTPSRLQACPAVLRRPPATFGVANEGSPLFSKCESSSHATNRGEMGARCEPDW